MEKDLNKNMFSEADHQVLRAAIRALPGLLSEVMVMRFWDNRTISEIAEEIGVSEASVEGSINLAFRYLREECLRHPLFSRSLFLKLQMNQVA